MIPTGLFETAKVLAATSNDKSQRRRVWLPLEEGLLFKCCHLKDPHVLKWHESEWLISTITHDKETRWWWSNLWIIAGKDPSELPIERQPLLASHLPVLWEFGYFIEWWSVIPLALGKKITLDRIQWTSSPWTSDPINQGNQVVCQLVVDKGCDSWWQPVQAARQRKWMSQRWRTINGGEGRVSWSGLGFVVCFCFQKKFIFFTPSSSTSCDLRFAVLYPRCPLLRCDQSEPADLLRVTEMKHWEVCTSQSSLISFIFWALPSPTPVRPFVLLMKRSHLDVRPWCICFKVPFWGILMDFFLFFFGGKWASFAACVKTGGVIVGVIKRRGFF